MYVLIASWGLFLYNDYGEDEAGYDTNQVVAYSENSEELNRTASSIIAVAHKVYELVKKGAKDDLEKYADYFYDYNIQLDFTKKCLKSLELNVVEIKSLHEVITKRIKNIDRALNVCDIIE